MSALPIEVTMGLERLRAVLARWWILLVLGPVVGLGAAGGILAGTAVTYEASTIGLVDEPQYTLDQQFGQGNVTKLNDLMPTFASLATSDAVLTRVAGDLGQTASPSDLRSHITVTVPQQTLDLQITATFGDRAQASTAARSTYRNVADLLASYGGPDVPAKARIQLVQVQAVHTVQQSRHAARNLLIGGLLGLALAVLVTFALNQG